MCYQTYNPMFNFAYLFPGIFGFFLEEVNCRTKTIPRSGDSKYVYWTHQVS